MGEKRPEETYGVNPCSSEEGHTSSSSPSLTLMQNETGKDRVELTRLVPCGRVGSWEGGAVESNVNEVKSLSGT